MNFCPPAVPRSGTEGGKRFRNSALAEYQNRKIFVSLIEKNFGGVRLKDVKKIFSVLLAVRRAETLGGSRPLRQRAGCCSKKVRTSSSNCDQKQLSSFLGEFVYSLASLSAWLASQISLYFGIKSKERTKSKKIFLSSRRQFVPIFSTNDLISSKSFDEASFSA